MNSEGKLKFSVIENEYSHRRNRRKNSLFLLLLNTKEKDFPLTDGGVFYPQDEFKLMRKSCLVDILDTMSSS